MENSNVDNSGQGQVSSGENITQNVQNGSQNIVQEQAQGQPVVPQQATEQPNAEVQQVQQTNEAQQSSSQPVQQTQDPNVQQESAQEQPAQEQVAEEQQQQQVDSEMEYTASERFIAAVGYISFLCLLPLILRRDSEYCQFHGKQALFVCISFFILRFLFIVPTIGPVFMILEIIAIIVMGWFAWSGSMFRIPFFADWADKLVLTKEEEEERQREEDAAANNQQV